MQKFIDAVDHYIQIIAVSKNEIVDELIDLAGRLEVDERREFSGCHGLANAPYLLKLRHRLFEGALVLTEQYILLNRASVLKNFAFNLCPRRLVQAFL